MSDFFSAAILGQILDFGLKGDIFWSDKSMVLSLPYILMVREGPLTDADAAVHKHDAKIFWIFEFESELMIEDRVYGVLEGHRGDIWGVNLVT